MKELLETGVSISLVYNEGADALIGRIKEYAVAVRENNETMSYGCLIWAKKGSFAAITDAESYLASQVTAKPDIVKHFKVTDRGIAVALVKTKDPYVNINNIKRFLTDLAGALSLNFYQSCCYDCGSTAGLDIYSANGTPVQACAKCGGKYKLIMNLVELKKESSAVPPMPVPPVRKGEEVPAPAPAETMPAAKAAPAPAAEEIPVPAAESRSDDNASIQELMAAETAVPGTVESAVEKISVASDDGVSIQELMADEAAEAPAAAEALPADRGKGMTADEYKAEFSELLAVKSEEKKYDTPFFARRTAEQRMSDEAEFAALLNDMKPTGEETVTEAEAERQKLDAESKAAENADFTGFMFEKEKEEAPNEDPWKNERREVKHEAQPSDDLSDFMLSELERDRVGDGELAVPEQEKDVAGHDANVAVTEYTDDSNDGENIDVEAISSTVNMPTDTSGKGLDARETPLEADGSVPLINPNSEYADVKPSPVNGPDAVEPLESRERIRAIGNDETGHSVPVGYASGEDPRKENGTRPTYRSERQVTQIAVPPSYLAQNVKKIRFGSDPVFGIIGALALGSIGVIIWVLLNTLGDAGTGTRSQRLIFSLGALAISCGTFGGYFLGGEEMDVKGIIISSVINVLFDFAGVIIKYLIMLQKFMEKVFGYNISLAGAFEWVSYQLKHASPIMLFDFWGTIFIMITGLGAFVVYFVRKAR